MSFYLSNETIGPTGFEPGEFLDLPPMQEPENPAARWREQGVSRPRAGGAALSQNDGPPCPAERRQPRITELPTPFDGSDPEEAP